MSRRRQWLRPTGGRPQPGLANHEGVRQFLEAKEYLGGFYLIDCENKERAIELATQIPDSAIEGLGVEVRQVMFADGLLEA
jgi:hypothetical protein